RKHLQAGYLDFCEQHFSASNSDSNADSNADSNPDSKPDANSKPNAVAKPNPNPESNSLADSNANPRRVQPGPNFAVSYHLLTHKRCNRKFADAGAGDNARLRFRFVYSDLSGWKSCIHH